MIIAIVLAAGFVVAAVLLGLGRDVDPGGGCSEAERSEPWFFAHSPSWLDRPLRSLDQSVAGGALMGTAFVILFGAAVVVGWIFSGIDEASGAARWDVAAAEWGRDNATEASTAFLDAVTDLGGTIALVVVMVLIGVYHSVRHDDRGPATYFAIVGIGVTLLNNGLKILVDRDRPDIAQLTGHAGASFPSGHSAAAAACWAAIALVLARRARPNTRLLAGALAAFIAAAVAATRVLLGVHWLSDVVAGVFVGWAWFLVCTIVVGGRSLRLGAPAAQIATAPDLNQNRANQSRANQSRAGQRMVRRETGTP